MSRSKASDGVAEVSKIVTHMSLPSFARGVSVIINMTIPAKPPSRAKPIKLTYETALPDIASAVYVDPSDLMSFFNKKLSYSEIRFGLTSKADSTIHSIMLRMYEKAKNTKSKPGDFQSSIELLLSKEQRIALIDLFVTNTLKTSSQEYLLAKKAYDHATAVKQNASFMESLWNKNKSTVINAQITKTRISVTP